MLKAKDNRFCNYYKAVIKKYSLFAPVLLAILATILFCVLDSVSLFDKMSGFSDIVKAMMGVLIGVACVLIIVDLVFNVKKRSINHVDFLLFASDVFAILSLIYLLVTGMDVIGFILLGVILILAALTALRIIFCKDMEEDNEQSDLNVAQMSFGEYIGAAFKKCGVTVSLFLILAAYFAIIVIRQLPFFSNLAENAPLAGIVVFLIVLSGVVLLWALTQRVLKKKLGLVDVTLVVLLGTIVLTILQVVSDFSMDKLILWGVSLIIVLALMNILSSNTIEEDKSGSVTRFTTKRNILKTFKIFGAQNNVLLLVAISAICALLFQIATALGLFVFMENNGIVTFFIIFSFILIILEVCYFAPGFKNPALKTSDSVLFVLDCAFILTMIIFITQFDSALLLPFFFTCVYLVLSILYTVLRLLYIREPLMTQTVDRFEEIERLAFGNHNDEVVAEESEEVVDEQKEDEGELPQDSIEEKEDSTESEEEETEEEIEETEDEEEDDSESEEFENHDENATEERHDESATSNGIVFPKVPTKTFEEKLELLPEEVKGYYDEIVNSFLSYKKVKGRISKRAHSFTRGRKRLALIKVVGKKSLRCYLSLDPNEYNVNKYHQKDVSGKKSLVATPMLMRVRSHRGLKNTLSLIDEVMIKNEIPKLKIKK